jgi:hypothetical protein
MKNMRDCFTKTQLRYALKEFGTVAFIDMLRSPPPPDCVLILGGKVVYRTNDFVDALQVRREKFPDAEFARCESKPDPEVELAKQNFFERKYAQEIAERNAQVNSAKARKKAA